MAMLAMPVIGAASDDPLAEGVRRQEIICELAGGTAETDVVRTGSSGRAGALVKCKTTWGSYQCDVGKNGYSGPEMCSRTPSSRQGGEDGPGVAPTGGIEQVEDTSPAKFPAGGVASLPDDRAGDLAAACTALGGTASVTPTTRERDAEVTCVGGVLDRVTCVGPGEDAVCEWPEPVAVIADQEQEKPTPVPSPTITPADDAPTAEPLPTAVPTEMPTEIPTAIPTAAPTEVVMEPTPAPTMPDVPVIGDEHVAPGEVLEEPEVDSPVLLPAESSGD
jgi:hypothetical protein